MNYRNGCGHSMAPTRAAAATWAPAEYPPTSSRPVAVYTIPPKRARKVTHRALRRRIALSAQEPRSAHPSRVAGAGAGAPALRLSSTAHRGPPISQPNPPTTRTDKRRGGTPASARSVALAGWRRPAAEDLGCGGGRAAPEGPSRVFGVRKSRRRNARPHRGLRRPHGPQPPSGLRPLHGMRLRPPRALRQPHRLRRAWLRQGIARG